MKNQINKRLFSKLKEIDLKDIEGRRIKKVEHVSFDASALILGVTEGTLKVWLKNKKIENKLIGRKIRKVKVSSLEEYFRNCDRRYWKDIEVNKKISDFDLAYEITKDLVKDNFYLENGWKTLSQKVDELKISKQAIMERIEKGLIQRKRYCGEYIYQ